MFQTAVKVEMWLHGIINPYMEMTWLPLVCRTRVIFHWLNSDYASPQVVAWNDDWAQFNVRKNAGILPCGSILIRPIKDDGGRQHNLNSYVTQKNIPLVHFYFVKWQCEAEREEVNRDWNMNPTWPINTPPPSIQMSIETHTQAHTHTGRHTRDGPHVSFV